MLFSEHIMMKERAGKVQTEMKSPPRGWDHYDWSTVIQVSAVNKNLFLLFW